MATTEQIEKIRAALAELNGALNAAKAEVEGQSGVQTLASSESTDSETREYLGNAGLAELARLVRTALGGKKDSFEEGYGLALEDGVLKVTLDTALFVVVRELPTEPTVEDEGKLHLVPMGETEEGNEYAEYLWVDGKWELMGTLHTKVDLSDYLPLTGGTISGGLAVRGGLELTGTEHTSDPAGETGILAVGAGGIVSYVTLDELAAYVGGHLSPCMLTIVPTPANAKVTINGEETSVFAAMSGTEVTWEVSADGYETRGGTLTLTENTTLEVVLTATATPGVLRITNDAWFQIQLDFEHPDTGETYYVRLDGYDDKEIELPLNVRLIMTGMRLDEMDNVSMYLRDMSATGVEVDGTSHNLNFDGEGQKSAPWYLTLEAVSGAYIVLSEAPGTINIDNSTGYGLHISLGGMSAELASGGGGVDFTVPLNTVMDLSLLMLDNSDADDVYFFDHGGISCSNPGSRYVTFDGMDGEPWYITVNESSAFIILGSSMT